MDRHFSAFHNRENEGRISDPALSAKLNWERPTYAAP
jgi:hypothetical protein